jgi:hypothetical protein
MGPIGFPETSVQKYHSALRNIAEELRYILSLIYSKICFVLQKMKIVLLFLVIEFGLEGGSQSQTRNRRCPYLPVRKLNVCYTCLKRVVLAVKLFFDQPSLSLS